MPISLDNRWYRRVCLDSPAVHDCEVLLVYGSSRIHLTSAGRTTSIRVPCWAKAATEEQDCQYVSSSSQNICRRITHEVFPSASTAGKGTQPLKTLRYGLYANIKSPSLLSGTASANPTTASWSMTARDLRAVGLQRAVVTTAAAVSSEERVIMMFPCSLDDRATCCGVRVGRTGDGQTNRHHRQVVCEGWQCFK